METTDTDDEGISAFLTEPETEDEAAPLEATDEPEEAGEEQATDDAEVDEQEASDEDADDTSEEDLAPDLISVRVDGKETQVTLDELKRSYSGQSYIQKGMKEAADAKRQAEQLFNALQSEQQKFLQFAQQVQQEGVRPPPKAPDVALAQRDTNAYVQALARYNSELTAYQQQQGQLAHLERQREAANQAAMQAHLQEQARAMMDSIPDLADPEKAPAYRDKLIRYGIENGYSPQELDGVDDARAVAILNKAMKYDALQQAKAKAAKPVALRTVKPTAKREEPKQLQRGKLLAKARQSGDADDLVKLFME